VGTGVSASVGIRIGVVGVIAGISVGPVGAVGGAAKIPVVGVCEGVDACGPVVDTLGDEVGAPVGASVGVSVGAVGIIVGTNKTESLSELALVLMFPASVVVGGNMMTGL
jgi:hypothetical protein